MEEVGPLVSHLVEKEPPMKVLIAEDDPVYRRLLESMLTRWGYDVTVATDGVMACTVLAEKDAPNLAVLDWTMPGLDGNQVCEIVRRHSAERYTWLIMLTARDRKEDLLRGLEAGADDYLVKPFDPAELELRLQTGRRIVTLQDELIRAREELRVQAAHDFLTGVWNRGAIMALLETSLERARREQRPLALLLIDLDHFKQINDQRGHPAGDAALREAARRMKTVLRPYDCVGRYGGEEFLVVLLGCNLPQALQIGERLRACLADEPVSWEPASFPITASLGLFVAEGDSLRDAGALLKAADEALYRAKQAGRNRLEVAAGTR
jgi:diguanylate cyclase (GGDEF)-like protein